MLSEKEIKKTALSAVKKTSAKIIKLKKPVKVPETPIKEGQPLFPPLDKFNTGYIKARENDPLWNNSQTTIIMSYNKKQLKKDITDEKKQAFKEGNMDNTGKLNNTGEQKDTDKKNKTSNSAKQNSTDK